MNQSIIKIGWIGTGVMGKSMAGHLIKKGYKLIIHNRTKDKANDLIEMGAVYEESPKELAKQVDYLFLMLGYPKDLETLIFDPNTGILHDIKPNSYVIDHTTSSPGLAERICHELKVQRNAFSLDAPVSGGDIGAKNGTLVTMVGGIVEAVDHCRELFQCYSQKILHMGGPGKGQHTKMANQIMIASTMIGVCEALIYGQKAGLQLDQMIGLLQLGAAGSFTLERLAPRMLRRDFEPGFYVKHFVKDLGIALEESRRLNISLPGTSMANQFYIALMSQGGENLGTQGLLKCLEIFNNIEVQKYNI